MNYLIFQTPCKFAVVKKKLTIHSYLKFNVFVDVNDIIIMDTKHIIIIKIVVLSINNDDRKNNNYYIIWCMYGRIADLRRCHSSL